MLALVKDGGFIGVRALNGLHRQTEGHCRNREFISPGCDNVWVLKVGACGEYRNVDELLDDMERMEISMGEDGKVTVTDGTSRYEIENNKLYVNGESVHHYPLDVAGHLVITGGKENGN